MKVTRALLLSSKKQAWSGEYQEYAAFFSITGRGRMLVYRYLVTDCTADGKGIVFEIYRVTQETYRDSDEQMQKRTRIKVADEAHVHEEFQDIDELINFLRLNQIDFENDWQPVEEQEV